MCAAWLALGTDKRQESGMHFDCPSREGLHGNGPWEVLSSWKCTWVGSTTSSSSTLCPYLLPYAPVDNIIDCVYIHKSVWVLTLHIFTSYSLNLSVYVCQIILTYIQIWICSLSSFSLHLSCLMVCVYVCNHSREQAHDETQLLPKRQKTSNTKYTTLPSSKPNTKQASKVSIWSISLLPCIHTLTYMCVYVWLAGVHSALMHKSAWIRYACWFVCAVWVCILDTRHVYVI